jgi:hypothetical protein
METWSSKLGVGRGADDPTPEKSTVRKSKMGPRKSDRLEMTGRSPLRRQRSALDYRAI